MKSLSVMHQAKHVGAYERFLMQPGVGTAAGETS